MKLSILIPSYNDTNVLTLALPRLVKENLPSSEIVLINDDPTFDLGSWVKCNNFSSVRVLNMPQNGGFTAALNFGIQETSSKYVFLCNSDLLIEPGYLKTLISFLERHPAAACVTGKILRYDVKNLVALNMIDTTGFELFKSRRVVDRGEGQDDRGQFSVDERVFGISGAAWLGRRAALEDVLLDGVCFNPAFYMYKEDVELAWRLQERGWESWYLPDAVAYHGRTSAGLGSADYLANIRKFRHNEETKKEYVRIHSMKNQWFILIMHETLTSFLRSFWSIMSREVMVAGYNLLTSHRIFMKSIYLFGKAMPTILRQRKYIQSRRTRAVAEILRSNSPVG